MIDIGLHDAVPSNTYHADPALSSGIAKLLINRSPLHAWTAHTTLNPNWQPDIDDKFDLGTAAHRLLLEGDDSIAVYVGTDWRTKDAKEFREDARANGQVPLLAGQAERVRAMVEIGRMQMAEHYNDLYLFAGGKPEVTIRWEDDHGVHCRARIDWLHDDTMFIDDYKTTSASADPRKWERTMYGMSGDVQVAWYMRGLSKITGRDLGADHWRFVVQETYPPYALSVVTLAPSAYALAQDKVQKAIDTWAVCLADDFWPAYPAKVAAVEVPTWEEMAWLEKTQDEE